ncbi:MAG: JAB domain-containing protein, partial [Clostridiales bacterium]|nr:JAB domain-containing protein [Clostridiales bacterium]
IQTIRDSGVLIQRTLPIQGTFQTQLNPKREESRPKISSPEDIYKYVKSMQDYDREFAKVLYLDTKNQVTGIEVVSVGSLNAAIVHPREVFKGAMLNNAASIVFIHNHPSGNPEPSREDVQLSAKLKETGKIVGIDVLDSLVVGKERYYSMKEDPPQGQKIFDPHTQGKDFLDELFDDPDW